MIFDTDELHVPNVATTVNDPVDVATYVDAVAPDIAVPFLYHWLPLDADDVNVTLLPWQKVVEPDAVKEGLEGVLLTVTWVALEVLLQFELFVTTTA